jgi:hypothetical protein
MKRYYGVIREITEFRFVIEAPDEQSARAGVERAAYEDGGPSGDYIETWVQEVPAIKT